MRKKFVAGNWKMNTTAEEGVKLAAAIAREAGSLPSDVAICPPFVYLQTVASALKGSRVALGGQDMYFEAKGAFTGEISGAMLKDVGCAYVILGHSVRRDVFGVTYALIN